MLDQPQLHELGFGVDEIIIMRSSFKLMMGLVLALGLASCTSSDPAPAISSSKGPTISDQPLTSPTATLTVHGLSCPQCASNVDKQLLAVKGVQQVHVNLGNGRVIVLVSQDQPPTGRQLAAAIKKSGYTLVSIEPGGELPLDTFYIPKTATMQK
jgi:copper chaperone CopZ